MPKVSVCMPVYNSEEYLKESIESVLAQTFTDFELLVIDDGSTDRSCDIVNSFTDGRIRLFRNIHDFIATSNMLIDKARGEYIARMDSDDRMLPNRLQTQVDIMDNHKEIDVLGGGFVRFGKYSNRYIPSKPLQRLTLSDFIGDNCIANPTVMMRRDRILAAGVRYEHDFVYAEDFRFWIMAVERGLYLTNTNAILMEYRSYDQQVSLSHEAEQLEATKRAIAQALHTINGKEYDAVANEEQVMPSSNNLTIIMPFLNEGEEVRHTVESIRETAGDAVDIIVINDCSFDGYDYRTDLEGLGVNYIFNKERLGVAESRNLGVRLCRTPYFLLLDAHMRFYDHQWHKRIVDRLRTDDRALLCCQTKVLERTGDGNVLEATDTKQHFGAYMPLQKGAYIPDIKWNNTEQCPGKDEEDIPFVLGAGYAASRRYWQYLRGLEGLRQYGSDEAYISLKVWLEGGRCVLLKDVVIGHIYRTAFPYTNNNAACVYNCLFIASVLFPGSLRKRAFSAAESIDHVVYEEALQMFNANKEQTEELRAYYHGIFKRDFKDVIKLHNIIQPEDIDFAEKYSHVLPVIAETIAGNIHGDGVVHGKTCAAIWLYEYAKHSDEDKWRRLADRLLQDVLANIKSGNEDFGFDNGLAGIGWGLMYMQERGLTTLDTADTLSYIINKTGESLNEEIPLSIEKKFGCPRFIPRNPKRWTYSMDGVLGATFRMMDNK